MTRAQADNWSISQSLAFLAAVFALVLGTLLPFAALAAVQPGHPLVICSAEGPQTIQSGGMDGPVNKHVGAKCAACVMPLAAALPACARADAGGPHRRARRLCRRQRQPAAARARAAASAVYRSTPRLNQTPSPRRPTRPRAVSF